MAATGRTVMMPSEYEAVNKGYLSTVKDMHSRGRLSDTRLLCATAAASGQLEEFKALRAENFPWGKERRRARGEERPPRGAQVGAARERLPVE